VAEGGRRAGEDGLGGGGGLGVGRERHLFESGGEAGGGGGGVVLPWNKESYSAVK